MRKRSIGLKAVAAVVVCVWIGPVSQAAGAVNRRVQRDEAVREGRRLAGEGKWTEAVAVCEKYLALMDKGGASERSRIVVLFVMGEACSNYGHRADRLRKGVATYLDIVRRTRLEPEKRVCLLNAAKAALKIPKGEAAGEARALFRRFLDRYPNAHETQQARRGLVQTHLAQGKIAEATQAMRKLEKDSPKGTDFSQPLFDISRAHFGKKAYDKVLVILQEIVRRYPNSSASSLAWIGMGEAYEKLGREAKMVDAYRKAAAKPAVRTQTSIMDASNTHNRAHQWLGKYYMKKENWAEALKWWRAWKPGSWCGTCHGSMVSHRAYAIAACLTKTGKVDEARKELEKIVFGKAFSCGSDVAGLWKRLDGLPFFEGKMPWRPAKAADLLVPIPEKATPHALARTGGKGREARWACVLLGRMKAPRTLATVAAKMGGEENYGCLRDYCYALALLATPEAYARLKDGAANGKGNHKAAAAKMLERYPKPGDAEKALSRQGAEGEATAADYAWVRSGWTSSKRSASSSTWGLVVDRRSLKFVSRQRSISCVSVSRGIGASKAQRMLTVRRTDARVA